MCSKTMVYTSITAVLLLTVVVISVFVKPSLSEEFDETIPEKRSSKGGKGPNLPPEDFSGNYLDRQGNKFAWQKIRLPSNLVPEKYLVQLHPNLKTFKFKGSVEMLLECKKKTNFVFFHAKQMELTNIKLYKVEKQANKLGPSLTLGRIAESLKLEMFSVQVPEGLEPGNRYILYVEFNASLAEKLSGFYKSSYKNKNGERRFLATTHFEPTDARAAFPCLDEPALKAKFRMVIIRDKGYTALANMPLERSETIYENGVELAKDYFQESVRMSSYLIAFVVCDFAHIQARTKSNVLVRVWAPPDNIGDAKFALEEGTKILDFYEKFFDIKYPLPKQDLIAIPDFSAGAMENWGLITYRSTSLLFNDKDSSSSNMQWVSTVVAHELAHQWFGNLVTMKWWNDLWLNEGFASFTEKVGSNFTHPEWKMMDQFVLDKSQVAMNLDQMSNSHPISVPVHNPDEINSLFDTISYDKGASIIRMLRSFIGDAVFQAGLQDYLKTHAYGNAETKDLWEALYKAWQAANSDAAKPVADIMNTWTLQMGFPLVTFRRENNKMIASQEHFLIHPKVKPALKSKFGYKWEIPLTYFTEQDRKLSQVWMGKDGKEVDVEIPANSGWFKANYEQKGFYRVNYDKEGWQALINQLDRNHMDFKDADRAGMIDDAFNIARMGQLDLTTALSLTLYLTKEKQYVPWAAALNNLGYIHSMLCTDDEVFGAMKDYMRQQVSPIVDELGFKDTGSHLQRYLRSSILRTAADYGHEKVKEEALKMFNQWMKTGKSISPNLRSAIYSLGVQFGGENEFTFVFEQYKKESVAAEQRKLMFALSNTQDPVLLRRLLKDSLDASLVRSQDSVAIITSVAANCKGRILAWDFVKNNWNVLFKRYGSGTFDFSRLILKTTSHFNTVDLQKDVTDFFENERKNGDLGSAVRASQQSLESIEANIDWVNKNKIPAKQWMASHTANLPRQDVEESLEQLERLNPNLADREDLGFARNDYYYRDQEEPRYDTNNYDRETGNYYD